MIKKYRKDHKLTQKQFANILKVSEITIRNWETNRNFTKLSKIQKHKKINF